MRHLPGRVDRDRCNRQWPQLLRSGQPNNRALRLPVEMSPLLTQILDRDDAGLQHIFRRAM